MKSEDQRIREVLAHKQVTLKDRKSTRLNSSHTVISYAVFCLKKKKKERTTQRATFAKATGACSTLPVNLPMAVHKPAGAQLQTEYSLGNQASFGTMRESLDRT